MDEIVHFFSTLLGNLRLRDLFDLFLLWVLIYRVFRLMERSGATQIISGMSILALGFFLAIQFELIAFHWVMESFFSNLFLILVVLFQHEIKRMLVQIGTLPFFGKVSSAEEAHLVDELSKALSLMSKKKWGALIVLEREMNLDLIINYGSRIDSYLSSDLLLSIFQPNSPIHDGAVTIREQRMDTVGSFLPLSQNPALDRNLGTRHRAAIGLTEQSDAVVLLVSEENGAISFVRSGQLKLVDKGLRNLNAELIDFLSSESPFEKAVSESIAMSKGKLPPVKMQSKLSSKSPIAKPAIKNTAVKSSLVKKKAVKKTKPVAVKPGESS